MRLPGPQTFCGSEIHGSGPTRRIAFSRFDEWHLVFASSFEQFTLGLMSWLHKHVGFSRIAFSCAVRNDPVDPQHDAPQSP
jgi:hypothetical protein